MSDLLNRGINAVTETAKYVQDTLVGQGHEAKAEADKEAVKSSETTTAQKLDSAGNFISNKVQQKQHEATAEAHKQSAQHS